MITNLYLCLRTRIEKGCYLFDVKMQACINKREISEITLGTIVTRTMETGEIINTYSFGETFLNLFGLEEKEIIEGWCNFAQEETKKLNEFFTTNI